MADYTDKITIKCKCPFCKMTYEKELEVAVTTRYDEPDDIHIEVIDENTKFQQKVG